MSFRNYFKERQEKRKMLSEIKETILGSKKKSKMFGKLNVSSIDEVFRIFVNLGNAAYFSGDNDVFEYFIESLFEMMGADSIPMEDSEIIKYVYSYGLMSLQNYNIIPYTTVISHLKENIFNQSDIKTVNGYIRILREFASKSGSINYEPGVMEVLNAFGEINNYFLDRKMHINSMYLKNAIISMVYSAEKGKHEYMKNKIVAKTKGMLRFTPRRVKPAAIDTDLTQITQEESSTTPEEAQS